jgi:hypothetical protein
MDNSVFGKADGAEEAAYHEPELKGTIANSIRKSRQSRSKNHFQKRDFSPQTVRMHMIRNLNAQVLPLVVYQNKETKKTVATASQNITKKFKDPDPFKSNDFRHQLESDQQEMASLGSVLNAGSSMIHHHQTKRDSRQTSIH